MSLQLNPLAPSWLMQVLDEIDYGIVLLMRDGRIGFVNHAARNEFGPEGVLQAASGTVRAVDSRQSEKLRAAVCGASDKQLRCMMTLQRGGRCVDVAVVPLPREPEAGAPVVLIIGRQALCAELSACTFALAHGLTPTEQLVMGELSAGRSPVHIARGNAVAISTIRSQIASIRVKTQAKNIQAIVRRLAQLPPLVTALRRSAY